MLNYFQIIEFNQKFIILASVPLMNSSSRLAYFLLVGSWIPREIVYELFKSDALSDRF